MGSLFSKKKDKQEKKKQEVPKNGAGKDRVNETDQAILDVKARQRKIKTYMKKMETQEQQATEKIKELLKAGQKQRAMIHLKQKKFIAKEVEKAQGA